MVDGFLLVDKPTAWTSHDVIAKLRGILGMRKVGHAGTLDPMATGLLVVGLGKGTRLLRFVQDLPKEYQATALFGVATDSGDADGQVIADLPVAFTEEDLRGALSGFVGTIQQAPPAFSAIKRDGKRLHELARAGIAVEVEPRPVEIHELELVEFVTPTATLRVRCGKGTYIRVLADDIAKALGTRAHLVALCRVSSGGHSLDEATTIGELEAASDPSSFVLTLAAGLGALQSVQLPSSQRTTARHGGPIESVPDMGQGPIAVLDGSDLVGVYRSDDDRLVPEVVVA